MIDWRYTGWDRGSNTTMTLDYFRDHGDKEEYRYIEDFIGIEDEFRYIPKDHQGICVEGDPGGEGGVNLCLAVEGS